GRRLDVVWTRSLRQFPALSFLRRSHLEGSQAGRSSRSAANEVRTGHQSQDCKSARPHNSRQTAGSRQRGDRMKRRHFITLLCGGAASIAAIAQGAADLLRQHGTAPPALRGLALALCALLRAPVTAALVAVVLPAALATEMNIAPPEEFAAAAARLP